MKLVLATQNPGKLRELQEVLDVKSFHICTLAAFESITEVPEEAETFEQNAVEKALGYARQTGCLTLADDSGLCVEALGGAPGIFSSRYAGEAKDPLENCRKLLKAMDSVPLEKRRAYFIAAVALARPGQLIGVVIGKCHGRIATELKGSYGFGYDPLFYYPPFGCTFGEAEPSEKNKVSHRREALLKIRPFLENIFQTEK